MGLIQSIGALLLGRGCRRAPGRRCGLTDMPAVARLDLDVLGRRVEAGLPGDDPVAARVDRRRRDGRRAAARAGRSRKTAQQAPSPQSLENMPGTPEIAEPGDRAHRAAARAGRRASGSSTGEPSITSVPTRSGLRSGQRRARAPPPRLWPIRTTGAAGARSASRCRRDSIPPIARSAQSALTRCPRVAVRRAAAAQPAGEHAERRVAGHEAGHEQHRRASRVARAGPQKVAIGEQARQLEAVAQLAAKRGYRRRARRQRRRHVPTLLGSETAPNDVLLAALPLPTLGASEDGRGHHGDERRAHDHGRPRADQVAQQV